MTSEKKPFFSVVIPLYNKQSHVKETIETVFNQTFQDYEIVVVNDGSTDQSVKVVKSIQDNRIKLIHQENQGVSVARNRGIQESKADYIAFLDADDIWLPEFLQTIYELIQKFPEAGLYATAYKKRKANGEESAINIQGLPLRDYVGPIPNYFESIVKGDNLVWTSATCIPKKVFIKNDIWFPTDEKYGEDQYVWARVAMQHEIAYNTKECTVYQIETENNTISAILKEREPHQSILILRDYRSSVTDEEMLNYFDRYIEKHILKFIVANVLNKNRLHALKQIYGYDISLVNKIKYFILLVFPKFLSSRLRKIKRFYGKN